MGEKLVSLCLNTAKTERSKKEEKEQNEERRREERRKWPATKEM